MLKIFEPTTDEALGATRQQWLAAGLHILYVDYMAETFQSVQWDARLAMLGYPCNHEIQITLPTVPRYKTCLIDVIGKYINTPATSGLEEEELRCVAELPNGWTLSQLREFLPLQLPATVNDLDLCRLNWYLGIKGFDTAQVDWIHPEQNRFLSESEFEAILASNGREGFNRWASGLALRLAPDNAIPEASLDLRNLCPTELKPYANFRPLKRFNFDDRGRQRFEWEAIRLHHSRFFEPILPEVSNG